MVYGDMSSDSAGDNYPLVVLCPDCVDEDRVITENGSSTEDCEECGTESRIDFENRCFTNAKTKQSQILCASCLQDEQDNGVVFEHDTVEDSTENCEICEAES